MKSREPISSSAIDAYVEAAIEFGRKCPAKLEEGAYRFVREFFDQCVLPVVTSPDPGWSGKYRRFVLRSAAELGARLNKEATGATVTREMVERAGTDLLGGWERRCPLPPGRWPNLKLRDPDPDASECLHMRKLLALHRP